MAVGLRWGFPIMPGPRDSIWIKSSRNLSHLCLGIPTGGNWLTNSMSAIYFGGARKSWLTAQVRNHGEEALGLLLRDPGEQFMIWKHRNVPDCQLFLSIAMGVALPQSGGVPT